MKVLGINKKLYNLWLISETSTELSAQLDS